MRKGRTIVGGWKDSTEANAGTQERKIKIIPYNTLESNLNYVYRLVRLIHFKAFTLKNKDTSGSVSEIKAPRFQYENLTE